MWIISNNEKITIDNKTNKSYNSDNKNKQINNNITIKTSKGVKKMEYAILDEIYERSEENREIYEQKFQKLIKSGIEKLIEPWNGSDSNLQAYIFHNYVRTNGPVDLLIIIREIDSGTKMGEFALRSVETAVYPIYSTKSEDAIDIPAELPAPDFHPDIIKFIVEKRSLPKKPYNEGDFDPTKHRWDINRIAQTLNISNRLVAQYCRAKNI